jgi:YVTN family beta-propeller protein
MVVDADVTHLVKVVDLNGIATPGATSPAMADEMAGPRMSLAGGASAIPQDVRLAPDGRSFVVADMLSNGVWVIDAQTLAYARFIPTGSGAHGDYPSRDASAVYVSNRDAGTVSVLDAHTLEQTALRAIPGGGSPDMGGLSIDGTELWLSGRYNSVVYLFDTRTGQVTHRIPVDPGPHGLLV